jgi:NAD(P)-dependent dehydrogenase (short-subunit alcohol dehydrogenase family)
MELTGQVALVTGGGRGIGEAIARELAAAGMRVAVAARTASEVEAVAGELGGLALVGDVTRRDDALRWLGELQRELGPLDLLVNNAGISLPEVRLWEVDPESWWRVQEVNLRGPLLLTHAALPGMLARGRGRVVSIVSRAASAPDVGISAYATSKAALARLGEVLAHQLDGTPLAVFSVVPGRVLTDMTRGRWPADASWTPPEAAARLVRALASGLYDALAGRTLRAVEDADLDALL